eukprot:gene5874-8101_t
MHGNHFRSHTSSGQLRACVQRLLGSVAFFPLLLLLWLGIIALNSSVPHSLRGNASTSNGVASTNTGVSLVGGSSNDKKNLGGFHGNRDLVTNPTHCVIVAGHAVMRLSKLSVADKDDSGWYLLAYQRDQGFPSIITSHIKKGIELMKTDPNALLLFSGGETRRDVGPISEAASYYFLAEDKKWMSGDLITNRVFLEEYARDSFENLMFSVCRFREITGKYPQKITVIGFDFKSSRFTNLHRKAIAYPSNNFTYIGIKSTHPNFNQDRAVRGEQDSLESFRKDLYGCIDPTLYSKRDIRNPFKRTVPYPLACPEMKELLKWCGPELIPNKYIPWIIPEESSVD